MSDRGRDVGGALTHIRTVLSRAETALADIERGYTEFEPGRFVDGQWVGGVAYPDPDRERMIGALNEVIAVLGEWRRTGRPLKAPK